MGFLMGVTRGLRVNKRRAVLGVVAALLTVRAIRMLQSGRTRRGPRQRVYGGKFDSWADIHARIDQYAPPPSRDHAKAQVSAIESWCAGAPDFGYSMWADDYVNVVVANGDRFHDFEASGSRNVFCISGGIQQLSRIETRESNDGLRLDVGHDSWGWFWEAQDLEACEALIYFAEQLRARREKTRS